MNTDDLQPAYEAFFDANKQGQYFVQFLRDIIVENHLKAEREPEMARDYAQRAKGAREVLDHITSVLTTPKGGNTK